MTKNSGKSGIKSRYKELYSAVEEILFRHDPIRINLGGNSDEYDPEVGTILPRLKDAAGEYDVTAIIHEEFVRWFGAELTGNREQPVYKKMGSEVWKAWLNFKR